MIPAAAEGRISKSSIETKYGHIVFENGIPVISGSTMKVIELVVENMAYGWSQEELHFQRPYLNLGQIHSALAYYWDHAAEMEKDLARRLALVEETKRASKPSPLAAKLKAKGLI